MGARRVHESKKGRRYRRGTRRTAAVKPALVAAGFERMAALWAPYRKIAAERLARDRAESARGRSTREDDHGR